MAIHADVGTYEGLQDGFPTQVSVLRRGVRPPIDSGMLQRRQTLSSVFVSGQAARREWTLNYRNARLDEFHALVDLWDLTAGGCETLTWSKRGTAYSGTGLETGAVRMMNQPLDIRSDGANTYSFTVTLQEVSHAP